MIIVVVVVVVVGVVVAINFIVKRTKTNAGNMRPGEKGNSYGTTTS